MSISVNLVTKVIYVPKSDLAVVGFGIYDLDVNWLRLQLKDWEDSEGGMAEPDTHRHNTQVTLSGVTYARTFEILPPYTVEFENGAYTVRCTGSNHNVGDRKVVNQVSLLIGNSAGLITVATGAGPTAAEIAAALIVALSGTFTPVDVKKVNGVTVAGAGVVGNEWGPA